MSDYKPRRCSKNWLDGDCPDEILAIIDHGDKVFSPERFDIIYTDVQDAKYGSRVEHWMGFYCLGEHNLGYHGEMQAHEVAAYRYRMKHRYAKWSTLPETVKAAVRRDIERDKAEQAKYEAEANA